MAYREYDAPIPVEFFDPILGYGKGHAIGVKESPDTKRPGKCHFHMLVRLQNGDPALIWQRYILPLKSVRTL